MHLTSKSRYAIKVMMDLAFHRGQVQSGQVQRKDVAKRQGVPLDYLDQILVRLRRAEIVKSVRGRGGGYVLAKTPDEINVFDIFSAVEDQIYPVECVTPEGSCGFDVSCIAAHGWEEIFAAFKNSLSAINLGDLVAKSAKQHHLCPIGGAVECRPGKSGSGEKNMQPQVSDLGTAQVDNIVNN